MNLSLWLVHSTHPTCHSRRRWLEFILGRFKFLGAPIGDREFAASFVQDKRAGKADVLLTEISGVDDAQVTHKLLSRCMGTARVMHAMRTTRPDWMLGALEHVDKFMAVTVETCFGFAMPPSAEVQASLPVSLGGLGFQSARRHPTVAYLCSRVASKHGSDLFASECVGRVGLYLCWKWVLCLFVFECVVSVVFVVSLAGSVLASMRWLLCGSDGSKRIEKTKSAIVEQNPAKDFHTIKVLIQRIMSA